MWASSPTESFSILRRAACPHAAAMARRLSGGGLWAARPTDSDNFAEKSLAEFAARRRKKIEIIFHRDMRVGKNTSQAASVEFLRSA